MNAPISNSNTSSKPSAASADDLTLLRLHRDTLGDFDGATRREWLVTNGIGGFAAGSVAGANTRRYHGMLIAALHPPVARTLLVAKLDATASHDGKTYALSSNEYADGTIDPHGYRLIEQFALDGSVPTWTYALGDAQLIQRIWMEHGHNATYVQFELARASRSVRLTIAPLCAYRDYHAQARGRFQPAIVAQDRGVSIAAFDGARRYCVVSDRGAFRADASWYWNFKHRIESQRGLDDIEDLYRPGEFTIDLSPGECVTLVCATDDAIANPDGALERERNRQRGLLFQTHQPDWIRQLTLAADQFVVQRCSEHAGDAEAGATVIAGYPWFSDWGRDTMIALPGLTLATGRTQIAAEILTTFARFVSQGMLPNRFPDQGETPEYNTVDATLWYFDAVAQYFEHSGDAALPRALYPLLVDIIDHHIRGTRYGIHVDKRDGLLAAGEPGVQLTWMDAKIGDWVVTPRSGKAVEINALWYRALRVTSDLARRFDDANTARRLDGLAQQVRTSFGNRFWFERGGHLYDVVDSPDRGDDSTLRPNQIFAVSLPIDLLDPARAKAVVDTCARTLWTSFGLRSLSPDDPAYAPHYLGGSRDRDAVYHQGTVWSWLLGPFALAHYRVYRDAPLALSWLSAMRSHLNDGCIGSISEIFDGDAPHAPRGCFAQAWGVAETLRAWTQIDAQINPSNAQKVTR
jgi:predicted glycogen debranching enzyme